RNKWIRRLSGGSGLLTAAWLTLSATGLTAGDKGTQGLGESMLARDIEFLQKGLAAKPENRGVPKVKAPAIVIALYVQDNMAQGDPRMIALRAQALKVAGALAKKDYAGAKAAADGLSKPAGDGEKGKLNLHEMHKFELGELMSVYMKTKVGGM